VLAFNKPYLPCVDKYKKYLQTAFKTAWLNNHGPLLEQLTYCLECPSGNPYIQFIN